MVETLFYGAILCWVYWILPTWVALFIPVSIFCFCFTFAYIELTDPDGGLGSIVFFGPHVVVGCLVYLIELIIATTLYYFNLTDLSNKSYYLMAGIACITCASVSSLLIVLRRKNVI